MIHKVALAAQWLFALAGVFICVTILVAHFGHLHLPCGLTDGCAAVAASSRSYLFGIPVAVYGLLFYCTVATIAGVRIWGRLQRDRSWSSAALALSLLAAAFSVYLYRVSRTEIHAVCSWCMASAVTCIVLVSLYAAEAQLSAKVRSCNFSRLRLPTFASGLAALGIALVVQISLLTKSPVTPRLDLQAINAVPSKDLLPRDSSWLGFHDAPDRFVVFADPQCPASRDVVMKLVNEVEQHKNIGVCVRQMPLSSHRGSYEIALLQQLAEAKKPSLECCSVVYGAPEGTSSDTLSQRLGVSLTGSPAEKAKAERKTQRDLQLARNLHLPATPFILLVRQGNRTALTPEELNRVLDGVARREKALSVRRETR